jgi:hypothetical protein
MQINLTAYFFLVLHSPHCLGAAGFVHLSLLKAAMAASELLCTAMCVPFWSPLSTWIDAGVRQDQGDT